MPLVLLILLFSLIGGVFSLIGGIVMLYNEKWVKRNTLTIVSWSAGVLLAVAFLDLFPEAIKLAEKFSVKPENVFLWPFLAMVGFFFLERSFVWFHHHHDPHLPPPTNLKLLIGDSVHNFIDGIVIATTFLISVPIGIATAIAVAAHEIPQEIADFGIFLKSGMPKGKVFLLNFASAMMTTVGAVVAILFAGKIEAVQPQLLAFAAGMFTYIATSDLIPELHHEYAGESVWKQSVSFVVGVGATYLLLQVTHQVG